MTETLEDRLKKKRKDGGGNKSISQSSLPLESRLSSPWNALKSVGRAAVTAGTLAATYLIVGKASLLTAGGNAAGYLIEKIKGKKKEERITDVVNEKKMHSEIRTGGIMGVVGYALYSMIDFIPNYNLSLKALKTVAFNPIMLAPYVAFYQAFTYLRDKVGTVKSIFGLLNLKIFKYLKDAYYNEIKPNFYNSIKKVMYLMPIHFASINYVQEIWKRVGIGVFNDIAFRLFQSRKEPLGAGYYAKNPTYYGRPAYQTT